MNTRTNELLPIAAEQDHLPAGPIQPGKKGRREPRVLIPSPEAPVETNEMRARVRSCGLGALPAAGHQCAISVSAVPTISPPDYAGGSLVNLMAELEHRLSGSSVTRRLHDRTAALIPDAATYVVVLFDGLGASQLDHPRARSLARDRVATIDTPFPATTTVSLATVATALPPSQHGLLGYQLWLPEVGAVVNTIKWTTLWGSPVDVAKNDFLPAPNLWERLTAGSMEPISVQPANFDGSGLSRVLYRGCRFEGVGSYTEQIDAVAQLAGTPGRLIYTYVAAIDYAAHVHGQSSSEYGDAVGLADWMWSSLAATVPTGVVLIGISDHGHLDFPMYKQVKIARSDHEGLTFYGDGRAMLVRGNAESLARKLPATWVPIADARDWWGPGPRHPAFEERSPDGVLVADDDVLLLHRFSDDGMTR